MVCFFLLFHQPPFVHPQAFRRVAKAFGKILSIFLKNRRARASVSVTASLLELLDQFGLGKTISAFKTLGERGQFEFVETAAFYPFLPLLPDQEIVYQIRQNLKICQKFLGDCYQPSGFFSPEMGFSAKIAQIVSDLGYKFFLVDELGLKNVDYQTISRFASRPTLRLLFSRRGLSQALLVSPKIKKASDFLAVIKRENFQGYLLATCRAEFFGYLVPGKERLLRSLMRSKELEKTTLSQLIERLPEGEPVEPWPSLWETYPDELKKRIFYPTIFSPDNPIHKAQWELTQLAIKTVYNSKLKMSKNWRKAREILSRSLFSDQYRLVCACRPWGIANILSFRAAFNLAKVAGMAGSKQDLTRARNLYEKIVFSAYQMEKEGWFDQKKPIFDRRLYHYRKSLIPSLPQTLTSTVEKKKRKEDRKRRN